MEIARVTPSLPQRGRQHEGASPLDPPRAVGYFSMLPRSTAILHGAIPEEAVSARGAIAIQFRSPLLVF